MVKQILGGALFGFLALSVITQAFAQEDLVSKRKAAMSASGKNIVAIGNALKENDYE